MTGTPGLLTALRGLADVLGAAREEFGKGPRPSAEALAALTVRLNAARAGLETAGPDGVEGMSGEDKVAAAREVSRIRAELKVLGRLATGGAWIAALLRDADATARKAGLYGAWGGAPEEPPSSFERRV